MGVFQLPESVDGDAAGCLVYSFACLLANGTLTWLIWTHHERTSCEFWWLFCKIHGIPQDGCVPRSRRADLESDVAYISYFTFLATVSSIIQQLYDYILWRDIMIEQFYYGKQHADDAETQYQRGIMGLKLALSYIRGSSQTFLPTTRVAVRVDRILGRRGQDKATGVNFRTYFKLTREQTIRSILLPRRVFTRPLLVSFDVFSVTWLIYLIANIPCPALYHSPPPSMVGGPRSLSYSGNCPSLAESFPSL